MLLVSTIVHPSQISGLGLFAAERIQAGSVIWKLHRGFDAICTVQDWVDLSPVQQQFMDQYAYLNFRSDELILCCDNARFFNHSEAPNTHEVYDDGDVYGIDVASYDIQIGQELTTNYRGFDGNWQDKLRSCSLG